MFHWFQGATVDELTRRLAAHPGARLEVHPVDTPEGPKCWLRVVPANAAAEPFDHAVPGDALDESHPCPPFCP
jgi:hypothetical protein